MSKTKPSHVGLITLPNNDEYLKSKIGGTPDWLWWDKPLEIQDCKLCKNNLSFILQLYTYRPAIPAAYHVVLYLFGCLICKESFTLLRSQLPYLNDYFPVVNYQTYMPKMISHCVDCGFRKHSIICPEVIPIYGIDVARVEQVAENKNLYIYEEVKREYQRSLWGDHSQIDEADSIPSNSKCLSPLILTIDQLTKMDSEEQSDFSIEEICDISETSKCCNQNMPDISKLSTASDSTAACIQIENVCSDPKVSWFQKMLNMSRNSRKKNEYTPVTDLDDMNDDLNEMKLNEPPKNIFRQMLGLNQLRPSKSRCDSAEKIECERLFPKELITFKSSIEETDKNKECELNEIMMSQNQSNNPGTSSTREDGAMKKISKSFRHFIANFKAPENGTRDAFVEFGRNMSTCNKVDCFSEKEVITNTTLILNEKCTPAAQTNSTASSNLLNISPESTNTKDSNLICESNKSNKSEPSTTLNPKPIDNTGTLKMKPQVSSNGPVLPPAIKPRMSKANQSIKCEPKTTSPVTPSNKNLYPSAGDLNITNLSTINIPYKKKFHIAFDKNSYESKLTTSIITEESSSEIEQNRHFSRLTPVGSSISSTIAYKRFDVRPIPRERSFKMQEKPIERVKSSQILLRKTPMPQTLDLQDEKKTIKETLDEKETQKKPSGDKETQKKTSDEKETQKKTSDEKETQKKTSDEKETQKKTSNEKETQKKTSDDKETSDDKDTLDEKEFHKLILSNSQGFPKKKFKSSKSTSALQKNKSTFSVQKAIFFEIKPIPSIPDVCSESEKEESLESSQVSNVSDSSHSDFVYVNTYDFTESPTTASTNSADSSDPSQSQEFSNYRISKRKCKKMLPIPKCLILKTESTPSKVSFQFLKKSLSVGKKSKWESSFIKHYTEKIPAEYNDAAHQVPKCRCGRQRTLQFEITQELGAQIYIFKNINSILLYTCPVYCEFLDVWQTEFVVARIKK